MEVQRANFQMFPEKSNQLSGTSSWLADFIYIAYCQVLLEKCIEFAFFLFGAGLTLY